MFRRPEFLFAFFLLLPLSFMLWVNFVHGRRDLKALLGQWRQGAYIEIFTIKWFFQSLALILFTVFIVLAIADPERRGRPEIRNLESRDIVFALDISRSMYAEDSIPSRLERSVDIIRGILASRGGTGRFALVVFRNNGVKLIPVTEDLSIFETVFENLSPVILSGAGTDIAAGLDTALDAFPGGVESERLLFVFSDGENFGSQIAPAAERATKEGVRIISFGAGTVEGATIPLEENGQLLDKAGHPVTTRLYDEGLRYLADETEGAYFSLNDPALMRRLDELFGPARRYTQPRESAYQVYLLAAVGLLCLYFLIRVVRWKDTF